MRNPDSFACTYGRGTPGIVHVYRDRDLTFYAVDGSVNVNATYETIKPGVDVEALDDVEHFTTGAPIRDEHFLADEVEDWLNG